jgi:hypothetical protein
MPPRPRSPSCPAHTRRAGATAAAWTTRRGRWWPVVGRDPADPLRHRGRRPRDRCCHRAGLAAVALAGRRCVARTPPRQCRRATARPVSCRGAARAVCRRTAEPAGHLLRHRRCAWASAVTPAAPEKVTGARSTTSSRRLVLTTGIGTPLEPRTVLRALRGPRGRAGLRGATLDTLRNPRRTSYWRPARTPRSSRNTWATRPTPSRRTSTATSALPSSVRRPIGSTSAPLVTVAVPRAALLYSCERRAGLHDRPASGLPFPAVGLT